MKILCSISTRNRYDVLPLAIQSVANQTRPPQHLVIYDDNDHPKDLRHTEMYLRLFQILDAKNIGWHIEFGSRVGQHFNHQRANMTKEYDAVWRVDDDCIAEPDVLLTLEQQMKGKEDVGAVGGSIIVPPLPKDPFVPNPGILIDQLDKPNIQWGFIPHTQEVDHLHCSFLYRPRIANYDMRLSKKAHREETMFTYTLKLKKYKVLVTPCITWHLKSSGGGIRSDSFDARDYMHDEHIFRTWLNFRKLGKKLYVLPHGLGDHYMFKTAVQPDPTNSVIACCYPYLFPGYEIMSIEEASRIVHIEEHNIYAWCGRNGWAGTMMDAYKEFYAATY